MSRVSRVRVISRKICGWLLPLLWSVCVVCQAAGYVVSTAVPSEAESDRLAAWRTGLVQVLVQQTGNADVASLPAIQTALETGERYVSRYDYRRDNAGQLFLNTVFSRAGVARLLRAAHQTAWIAPARPLLVIASLNLEDSSPGMRAVFKTVAAARGLPLEFASMDLADQSHLASLSGVTPEISAWFAERYQTKGLLFVDFAHDAIKGRDQEIRLQAHLYLDGSPYAWQTAGNTLSTAARELIEQAIDAVVREAGTQTEAPLLHDWVIEVRGIESIAAYHDAVAWVSHVLGVNAEMRENLTANGVQIQCRSSLSAQALRSRLTDGGRLMPLAEVPDEESRHLVYFWRAGMDTKQEAPDVA